MKLQQGLFLLAPIHLFANCDEAENLVSLISLIMRISEIKNEQLVENVNI